ncbi:MULTISPECIES: gamma-glutamyltransferase [Aminobacterium]|jgi:gamma-glutamyltranspeptidase/glutathione hydrolase|uniref:gamma-glutamyltransferase n=1 Tax=Aminobacterium TaxID=81466 RepID=UPI0004641DB8|nr:MULTISPECIES: gamma-glutamyltransferase [Aminobacterium]
MKIRKLRFCNAGFLGSGHGIICCSFILYAFLFFAPTSQAVTIAPVLQSDHGIVVAMNPDAAKVGAEILEKGGNAFDAAIAVSVALGVVEPYGSGLGGEGYLIGRTADGERFALDFRSVAPHLATYENIRKSKMSFAKTMQTLKGAGVPGLPAALEYIHKKLATMPLSDLISPAIHLAEEGFVVTKEFAQAVAFYYDHLILSAPDFLKNGQQLWKEGDRCFNLPLAQTLRILSQEGLQSFYSGSIADSIETFMKHNEGWIQKGDLQSYSVCARSPLHGTYRDYDIYVAGMPAGGPRLIETLNILEKFNISAFEWDDPLRIHLMQEIFILTALDQEKFVGDTSFDDLPEHGLVDKKYAQRRFMELNLSQASSPEEWKQRYGNPLLFEEGKKFSDILIEEKPYKAPIENKEIVPVESSSTTHFAIVDQWGNTVSWTQTISDFWGTGYWVGGFFLNNELCNFQDGSAQGDPLYMEEGKRPRTTIAPLIIEKGGKIKWVLGTPGGGRIVSTLVQVIVDLVDFHMTLEEAVKAPKFVGYTLYPELRMEDAFPVNTIKCLEKFFGHTVKLYPYPDAFFGGLNAIGVNENGIVQGIGSLRRNGAAGK